MKKNLSIIILLIISYKSSYCQQVHYDDLMSTTWRAIDSSKGAPVILFEFKDSLNVVMSAGGSMMINLVYELDPVSDATLLTMKDGSGSKSRKMYMMIKKINDDEIKLQGFDSSNKPTKWNNNLPEGEMGTMVRIKGTVGPPK